MRREKLCSYTPLMQEILRFIIRTTPTYRTRWNHSSAQLRPSPIRRPLGEQKIILGDANSGQPMALRDVFCYTLFGHMTQISSGPMLRRIIGNRSAASKTSSLLLMVLVWRVCGRELSSNSKLFVWDLWSTWKSLSPFTLRPSFLP